MRLWKPKLPTGYHEQTYASPYAIVRYPHQKRVSMGVDSAIRAKPTALLDYGAGDGKVLIEAIRSGLAPETSVVAFEPVEQFQEELLDAASQAGVSDQIELVSDRAALYGRSFDHVLCLGVLEHMPLPERIAFYEICKETLTADGTILIDVPVEIGPTLLIKAGARRLLKGREKEYSAWELLRTSLGAVTFDASRFDPTDSRTWIHHHRGFDYRLLRKEVAARFNLTSEIATPIGVLPAPMGNQEIFLAFQLSAQ
jgi:Methyltransferase domain